MQRVVVFGASGSGKTTLGHWLSERLNLPFTDLDDVHWRPGWTESPTEEFRAAVDSTTSLERWVVAGNYGKVRDLLWPRADTLIWLDLPLAQALRRSAARALRQWWTKEAICNGNRQTLVQILNGRDSLLGYTLCTYHARRREWPRLLNLPEHARATVVHLRSATEIATWQAGIQPGKTPVDK